MEQELLEKWTIKHQMPRLLVEKIELFTEPLNVLVVNKERNNE